jgi:hypothetical protein
VHRILCGGAARRRAVGATLAAALLAALAGACGPALAQSSPVDRWQRGAALGDQYSDFNTHLIHVQTVKSIPFFGKTGTGKLSAIRGYYRSARAGNVRSAGTSFRNDFGNGALAKDVAIAMTTQVLTQISQGRSVDESVGASFRYLTSAEYLLGNLMGGTLGAALGTMIPVPVLGGVLGQLVTQVPTMAGAMLGSNVGAKIVHGVRRGDLDLGAVLASVDWMNLTFQSVGATAGMLAGNSLPVPFLGQIVGGVIGGSVGLRASRWVKRRLGLAGDGQDFIDVPEFAPAGWSGPAGPAAPHATGASTGVRPDDLLHETKAQLYRSFVEAERLGARSEAAEILARYQAVSRQIESRR